MNPLKGRNEPMETALKKSFALLLAVCMTALCANMAFAALTDTEKSNTMTEMAAIDPVFFGEDAIIRFGVYPSGVSGDVTGDVVVTIDGRTYTTTAEAGTITIPTLANKDDLDDPMNINAGNYLLQIEYLGNDNFKPSKTAKLLTVAKNKVDICVEVEKVYSQKELPEINLTFNSTSSFDPATGGCIVNVNGQDTYYDFDDDWDRAVLLPQLPVDEYLVTVTYPGDRNYEYAVGSFWFRIKHSDEFNSIDLTVPDVGVGEHAQATVVLSKYALENMDEEKNEVTLTVKDSEGETVQKTSFPLHRNDPGDETAQVTVDLGAFAAGAYTVEAVTSEPGVSGQMYGYATSTDFRVRHKDTAITLSVPQNLTAGEAAQLGLRITPAGATGEISVFVDGKRYTAAANAAAVSVPALDAGTHEILARYAGDDKFVSAETRQTMTVAAAEPKLRLEYNESCAQGETQVIGVTLEGAARPTGEVTVMIDNEPYTAKLSGNKASVTVPAKPAGTYVISAYYGGDLNNKAAIASGEYTVAAARGASRSRVSSAPARTTDRIQTELRIKPIAPVTFGEDVTIELEMLTQGVTGTIIVQIIKDGKSIWRCDTDTEHLTLTVPTVNDPDNIPDDVLKPGMEKYLDSYDNTVSASYDADYYGQTHDYWVPYDPYEPNGNLNAGGYMVAALFNGDSSFTPATDFEVFTVNKMQPTASAEFEESGGVWTATLDYPSVCRAFTVIDGHIYPINQDYEIVVEQFPSPGSHNMLLTLEGGRNQKWSITPIYFETSENEMCVDVPDVRFGERAQVTVSMPAKDVSEEGYDTTVEVAVRDADGKLVCKEEWPPALDADDMIWTAAGTLDVPDLGEYTVEATFRMTEDYPGGRPVLETTVTKAFRVLKKEPSFTLTVPEGLTAGGSAEITAVLTPAPGAGEVTVTVDGLPYVPEAGTGRVTVPDMTAGCHTVRAAFAGNDEYAAAEKTAVFTVSKNTADISLTAENKKPKADETQKIVISVSPAVTGAITVKVNNKDYNAPVDQGRGELVLPMLPAGKYVVAAFLPEDETNAAAFGVLAFTVDNADRLPGDVDGNGKVETTDARLALRRAIGLETYVKGSAAFFACDVTKDGKVGTDDARFILRHAVGLSDPQIAW